MYSVECVSTCCQFVSACVGVRICENLRVKPMGVSREKREEKQAQGVSESVRVCGGI